MGERSLIERHGLDGYVINLPGVTILRINCGRRPQVGRPRWTGVYTGGMETAPGRWEMSWELADKRWRAVCFDFVFWRCTIKLWPLPVEPFHRGRSRGRWELLRFALLERGRHDDNLPVGWVLDREWLPDGLFDRVVLPRLWKGAMLTKLAIAVLLNRERSWSWQTTEEWMAAAFDGDSYASMEGTFYEWTELRTPARWHPRYWTFDVNREST